MKKVRLFWNHICILHHFEKTYLKQLQTQLLLQNIELEITCFGLGYPYHLSEYLIQTNDFPDLIVSADLEVFEYKNLFQKIQPLYKTLNWLPLEKNTIVKKVIRNDTLLPIVIIPMVLYGKEQGKQFSLLELAQKFQLGFGGINNSAGKTIVKAIWQTYGKEATEDFLHRCHIFDMPINAFQSARNKEIDLALVPSIYANRADNINFFQTLPQEGVLLLPSYFCARTSVDETIAKKICATLLSSKLLNFYRHNGNLISCIHTQPTQNFPLTKTIQVNPDFISTYHENEFYELYCKHIPYAKNVSTQMK